jgi:hypothetical protein
MITVSISINGEPIYTRTAVNRLKEHGVYVLDTGERIHHHPDDGPVELARKMLHTIEDDPDELSLCKNCWCMTKTWHGKCKKCRAKKERE